MTIKDFVEKKVAIAFKNAEQIKEFAKMCEGHGLVMAKLENAKKEDAVKWMLEKPEIMFDGITLFGGLTIGKNKFVFFTYDYVEADMPGGLSWSGNDELNDPHITEKGWKIVPFEEFKKPEPAHKIEISYDGEKVTTARMIVNGKVVKEATSRRNPEDKFDFKKGAALAFNRLFKCEPEKKEFKVGDRVVCVRKIEDVAEEVIGKHGVVIKEKCGYKDYIPVEFDENIKIYGHSCDGAGKNGHCRWVPKDSLKLE